MQEKNPELPDFVPDSAATGTAWATGHKTSNGRISTTAGDDRDLPTILELAQERGYRTGDITTAELTDATPAVLASHVAHRSCQGPTDMALCPQDQKSAGGPGSIAEQLIDHHVDVLMGGGYTRFDQATDAGPRVVQQALAAGYRIVTAQAGLEYVEPGRRVLGLFAAGNMTVEWRGAEAVPIRQRERAAVVRGDQRPNAPSLAEMTARRCAARRMGGRSGFFAGRKRLHRRQDPIAPHVARSADRRVRCAIRIGLDFARRIRHADCGDGRSWPRRARSSAATDADHPTGL